MIRLLILFASLAVAGPASASFCRIVNLEEEMKRADVVMVVTVITSRLTRDPDLITHGSQSLIEHEYIIARTIKGKPTHEIRLVSRNLYNDPKDDLIWLPTTPELPVVPGDSLLIVAGQSETVEVMGGGCAASRHWDQDTREEVEHILRSAP